MFLRNSGIHLQSYTVSKCRGIWFGQYLVWTLREVWNGSGFSEEVWKTEDSWQCPYQSNILLCTVVRNLRLTLCVWSHWCLFCPPTAELGDYEEGYHTPAVVSEFHFIPNQTEEMEIAVLEEYKKCRCVNLTSHLCLTAMRGICFNLNLDTVLWGVVL